MNLKKAITPRWDLRNCLLHGSVISIISPFCTRKEAGPSVPWWVGGGGGLEGFWPDPGLISWVGLVTDRRAFRDRQRIFLGEYKFRLAEGLEIQIPKFEGWAAFLFPHIEPIPIICDGDNPCLTTRHIAIRFFTKRSDLNPQGFSQLKSQYGQRTRMLDSLTGLPARDGKPCLAFQTGSTRPAQ